jgi:putative ABC transport system substrate-binding protein
MRYSARKFCMILAFVALADAGAVGAQQSGRMYRIGVLTNPNDAAERKAISHALGEQGYVEGRNFAIEWRVSNGHIERLPKLAAELVAHHPNCIVAIGVMPTWAAKRATATIPIVMGNAADDPVRQGLIASYAHPGGNITGYTNIVPELAGKRLGLLRDLIPGLSRVAVLWQTDLTTSTEYVKKTEAVAATIALTIDRLPVRDGRELAGAFREAAENGAQAVIVPSVGMMNSYRRKIAALAIAARLPLMATNTPFAVAGALLSYDADRGERYRQVAGYVARILKGEKPRNLPVLRKR